MNLLNSSIFTAEVPAYVQLQRQMHDALLAQHPEWVQSNGDCPTCDSYEVRFAELLTALLASERTYEHDEAGNIVRGTESFRMPSGYTEETNILFRETASVARESGHAKFV